MVTLGRHSYMGNIKERYEPQVSVGNFTSIASDVTFMGTCQHPQVVSTYPFYDKGWDPSYPKSYSKGQITIGNDVWIGEGAVIMDGVTIGDGAIIGAYSVIRRDVLPYAVVKGNPQQVGHYRFTELQIKRLLRIAWWDWSDQKIIESLSQFDNIKDFIKRHKV